MSAVAHADDFQVLAIKGQAEISPDKSKWENVQAGQTLSSGTWIKTGANAKVTILLPDRTQTIIARNSEVQLNKPSGEKKTTVKVNLGKLWAKTNKKPISLSIKAPNAAATIRGTEWVVDVSQDGQSSMAVVEGYIALRNNDGEITEINNGELAIVGETGQISVSRILNPKSYIQFVFRYEVEPQAYLPNVAALMGSQKDEIKSGFWSLSRADTPACGLSEYINTKSLIFKASKSTLSCIQSLDYASVLSKEIKNWLRLINAEALFAVGDVKRGTDILDSLPESLGKTYVTAKFKFSNGQYEEATKLLRSLVSRNEQTASSHVLLGQIFEAKGDKTNAFVQYRKASLDEPRWYLPHLHLGRLHLEFSNFDAAIDKIRLAKQLEFKGVQSAALESQYQSYRYQLLEARRLAEQVIAVDSNNFEQLVALGIIELKAGNAEQALANFTKASAIERNYSRSYLFMAVAHLHLGETEQALIQLRRAIALDPNDPLPDIVSSQIQAASYNVASALFHAQEALKKTRPEERYSQLANDLQGGVNVGRRFLEVGLPNRARQAALESFRDDWAGGYFFNAATAKSDLERNSNLIRGFTIDSQAFGTRRDQPDVIAKPGEYGYREYRVGSGYENSDFGIKIGGNSRQVSDSTETSKLYDIGLFGTEKDAYASIDDTDKSIFALGFFGYGKRENFDKNTFITANVVPFKNDSSYPVKDLTGRIDAGKSKRSDKSIFLETYAVEAGSASFQVNISDKCRGDADMNTKAIEYGVGEVGRVYKKSKFNWALEGAYRKGASSYDVKASTAICDDLTSIIGSNYQILDEDVRSLEYEWIASGSLSRELNNTNHEFHLRTGYYHHEVDQDIIADGVANVDIRSDAHRYRFRPSYGITTTVGNFILNAALIREYHPLRQAALQVGDISGISPHFEFVNTGGKLDQQSIQLMQNLTNDGLFTVFAEDFTVRNNEIYMLFREQWNSDLLANFSLSKYYNANVEPLFYAKNRFAKGRFKRKGVSIEIFHEKDLTSHSGLEYWSANELDHPKYVEPDTLGRIDGIPKQIAYVGITKILDGAALSGRIQHSRDIWQKSNGTTINKTIGQLNYTAPFGAGEITLDLNGEIDNAETLKSIMLFRIFR